MNRTGKDFRDRLIEAEGFDPSYREAYEKEIQAMLEEKVAGTKKWVYVVFMALGAFFAVVFGAAALLAPAEFPLLGRILFGVGAIFGLAWAVLLGMIVKKGKLNLRTDPGAMAGMAWATVVIAVTLFMLLGSRVPEPITGVQMVVNGLVFLVMGAVFMVFNRIHQAELKTREKLLEIEYQLAAIAEAMAEKQAK